MSESTFKELWPHRNLSPLQVRLCSYSGESIPVLGSVDVTVTYKQQYHTVPLIIVKGSGLTLMAWTTYCYPVLLNLSTYNGTIS